MKSCAAEPGVINALIPQWPTMSTLDLKGDRAHWANYEGSTCFHQGAGTSVEQHDASTRLVERHTWNSR